MPVIHDIPLTLNVKEVLRRQGLEGAAEVRPETKDLILELLASVRETRLVQAAAYRRNTVTGINGNRISLEGGGVIRGPLIPAMFAEAKELAVLLCTIGPRLENRVTDYSRSAEVMKGMILDGIRSTALDMMVLEVLGRLADDVSSRSYRISSPVNPGMPGFPLNEQRNLLGVVKADEIGLGVTSSGMLVPRTSTSMVIGIGPNVKKWTQAAVCSRCRLRETCHYSVTE